MICCERCGEETPPLEFCVRCGNALSAARPKRGVRTAFAAAPHENAAGLHVISTLFPQLPRADMDSVRLALGIGVAVMLVAVAVGQYPAALAAAAVTVPIVVAIYLHDVNVYEDEPLRVVAFTMAWGAIAGIGLTLLSRAWQPGAAALATGDAAPDLVIRGIVLPIVDLVVVLLGPLALLRYRKFNEVLDGATFGSTAAVAFLGARALIEAFDLTASGPSPAGAALARIPIVLNTGLLLPLLAAGAVGAATGAVWLDRRSALRRRRPLGVLGNPLVAIALAAVALVGASLAQSLLSPSGAFAVLFVIAGASLAWLRLTIHVGLLEEASDREIGPDIRCANCGRMTPHHTFCGHCGISLRALPKATIGEPAQAREHTSSGEPASASGTASPGERPA